MRSELNIGTAWSRGPCKDLHVEHTFSPWEVQNANGSILIRARGQRYSIHMYLCTNSISILTPEPLVFPNIEPRGGGTRNLNMNYVVWVALSIRSTCYHRTRSPVLSGRVALQATNVSGRNLKLHVNLHSSMSLIFILRVCKFFLFFITRGYAGIRLAGYTDVHLSTRTQEKENESTPHGIFSARTV